MTFSNNIKVFTFKVLLILVILLSSSLHAVNPEKYVTNKASQGNFPVAVNGKATPILVSDFDFPGVLRVLSHLQNDIKKVTGNQPQLFKNTISTEENLIIVGTLGKSTIIDQLVKNGKIDASMLEGKWEKFIIQSINNPFPGVKNALVIAGSDKRGTIYGMYDLSNEIGVHPWHFWADVPVKKQTSLYVSAGIHTKGEPKVKYRGIFINDEAPALTGWVSENYGKFNSQFYENVFELILRMKGNYLWPAMWLPRKFYEDDIQNSILADEYGIVMGTSHHEPLTRAHAEWDSKKFGPWDFDKNQEALKDFWKGGMKRMGQKETIVTIGMRGDGDEAMSEGTAIGMLENIVKAQRTIIADATGKPAEETPQVWALYKEVQDYYDKGMQVPDDVTLLLCDDNWGNIRKLPDLNATPRKGGYGIYYHYDYVGGPRNYKWLNTNQIERVWEQMHVAYQHGVNQLWIVNVGDIKPMEFPIQFWFENAWNPEAFNPENLDDYYTIWTKNVFEDFETNAIADIMRLHTKFNARRKHELLDTKTYSLTHFNEANKIVEDYNLLSQKAQDIYNKLPTTYKDAYYQLVLFPVLASANLNELYVTAAKNNLYAEQGRITTNVYAAKVQTLFDKDIELSNYYHNEMANGKWHHMMSQIHIGYTSWQQPEKNIIPATQTIEKPSGANVGVSIEGSSKWWFGTNKDAILPMFDVYNNQSYHIEIFNRSSESYNYKIKRKAKWILVSELKGTVTSENKITISIDWKNAPKNLQTASILIQIAGQEIPVYIQTNNYASGNEKGFVENNGFIVINADNFSNKYEPESFSWNVVTNLGKTGSSVISLPVNKGRIALSESSPKLSYNINIQNRGKVKVYMYFSPTINYATREGMYYGLSFNKEVPKLINYDNDSYIFNYNGKVPKHWDVNVADNIKIITTEFEISEAGNHTLNYYRVDEGLVLQKIIIETETSNLKETYLGPNQTIKIEP